MNAVGVIDPTLAMAIRLMLAVVFATAAAHKLRDARGFRETLSDYRLVPMPVLRIASRFLPAAELLTAMALLLPAFATPGLAAAAALLLLYAIAIGINLLRGRRSIDCGCTGFGSGQPISGWLVIRNLALAAAAALAYQPSNMRALNPWDYAVALCAAGAFCLLYAAVNQLLANAPRLALLRTRYE